MELEIKIPVTSIEEFEKKISFAKFCGEERQVDVYFKMPPGALLRVRRIQNKGILGLKLIRDEFNSEFEEIECEVSDAEEAMAILKKLGFEELVMVEKLRKTYKYGNITLELNRVRELGDFVDFEIISDRASDKNRLIELIKALGYSEQDIDTRLYTELVMEKKFQGRNPKM